jgi:UDP-N-acetylmuramate--alanine ligase
LSLPDPLGPGRFHYVGVGGSGMSALAQFQALQGGRVSGSDRSFDRPGREEAKAQLERLGIRLHPQDGSGVGPDCAAVVASTAVEAVVPDVRRAEELGLPHLHRAEMLAHWVAGRRAVAVAGTSGKSTTVAMVFELLRASGRDPSVITGGELLVLQRAGYWGNAWVGGSDLLVCEADESDGTLVHYRPAVGVVLNLGRDHKEPGEVLGLFQTFRGHTRERMVVGECQGLASLAGGALVFGLGDGAQLRARDIELARDGSRFEVEGVRFDLPVPGRHNVLNALAALAACRVLEVPLAELAAPLAGFQGVGRRFQSLGSARGVEVIDDFAHNPEKLRATFATARLRARRLLAIYQPHGFGPTRFLRDDFIATFAAELGPEDRLWLLEIFYAGGTARRDVSSEELAEGVRARGRRAECMPSRQELVARLVAEARDGDAVLVMGARDPSLTGLAHAILKALGERQEP